MKLSSSLGATALLLYSSAVAAITVEVESQGVNFEEAKRGAYRQAIERATGILTISEQEVQGYKITRDYIGSYSSGWIDRYEILDAFTDVNGVWYVRMQAKVRDNKIKNYRDRNPVKNSSLVNGPLQSVRLTTQIEQRNQGDQFLSTLFRNYPEDAFVVNQGNSDFTIDKFRAGQLTVNYNISLSTNWLDSLREALLAISVDGTQCNNLTVALVEGINRGHGKNISNMTAKICAVSPDIKLVYKNKNQLIPSTYSFYFADSKTLEMVNLSLRKTLGQQHIGLRVDLLDAGGGTINSTCAKINNEFLVQFAPPNGVYNYNQLKSSSRPYILGHNQIKGSLQIPLNDVEEVEDLARIKLTVQNSC